MVKYSHLWIRQLGHGHTRHQDMWSWISHTIFSRQFIQTDPTTTRSWFGWGTTMPVQFRTAMIHMAKHYQSPDISTLQVTPGALSTDRTHLFSKYLTICLTGTSFKALIPKILSGHSSPRTILLFHVSMLTWTFSSRFVSHRTMFVQSLMWTQKYLTESGHISSSEYLKTAQAGDEVTLGSGTFTSWVHLPCPDFYFDPGAKCI